MDAEPGATVKRPSDGSLSFAEQAAAEFAYPARVEALRHCGHGNVHDTFLVELASDEGPQFILQRMNTHVFPQPNLVMRNIRLVTEHIGRHLQNRLLPDGRRWEVPRVLATRTGTDHWIDAGGAFWRALSFISTAQPFETIQNEGHAQEVGFALGFFHRLISDLPVAKLYDTLKDFHVTPRYLLHYDKVLAGGSTPASPEIAYALQFVQRRRAFAGILETARDQGRISPRPIHGDPKVNNIMIDIAAGQAVSLIDLDTVKPGLIHYDIGDCLRSCCNPAGEESQSWERVRFEPELGRRILLGYLVQAKSFFSAGDYDFLYEAVRLITFELGLRFLTDHLEGDLYFKPAYPEHNLVRALVQFKLCETIEDQEDVIRTIIRELR